MVCRKTFVGARCFVLLVNEEEKRGIQHMNIVSKTIVRTGWKFLVDGKGFCTLQSQAL